MTYGNFQTGEFDEALNRLNNTKQINERDPFIGEGDHVLLLVSLEPFKHTTHGPSARANFEVLQSPVHPVGSRVTKLWFLTKPSKFPTQANDSDRFADFIRQMAGAPAGFNVAPQCAAVIRDRVNDQLLRGMVIKARGVNTSKNPAKPWVEVYWTSVTQTPDEIKARRMQVEAKIASAPVATPQQQYAPTPVQQPQYVPQQQPQQYGPPPGYVTAPAYPTPAAPPGYAMMPPNAPQAQPAWPPQVQAPQQQAAPAPATGGLLSQIPGF